ncbi:hypothetical protein P43SY_005578 [Pythium insidiosum]|uniref:Oxidoreductase n=1 Tax=Pythium insidiosum TaxID=114742 RepID=A0AAD5LL78_PYTIN|nr:hypothetical protein P43SY_005578 [Pythium insidiosum]
MTTNANTALRVGLVGFGTASSVFHAPLLQSAQGRFVISHVLERSTNKSATALTPAPTVVRSMEEMLAASIDVVVIATPTSVHFDQAKQSLLAGKHVVVDKPLCLTAAQAQELVDLAQAQGVVFTVFHNRRWDSDFLTLRSLLASGKLGEVTHYEAHFDRYRPTLKGYWKEKAAPGGGILYDLGAHLVDQALVLFGTPDDVQADVQIQREGAENDDFFRLELSYNARPSLKVVLTAGMLVKEAGPKLIVEGSKGRLEKFGEDIQEQSLRDGRRPGDDGWGREPASQHATFTHRDTGATETIESVPGSYEVFYANLADAIQHGASRLVDPQEIVAQIRILETAKQSTRRTAA